MSSVRKADVIVPVDDDRARARRCLQAVLERSGPALGRLIAVDNLGRDSRMIEDLERLAARDSRVRILSGSQGLGPVHSYNRGLSERRGDAVLLASDCIAADDWLVGLAAVAYSQERTACASPLTNLGGLCSVPELNQYREPGSPDEREVRAACAGLPAWTIAPMLSSDCIYLRGDVIDAVGSLDPSLTGMAEAVGDWIARARALGFMAKRANHVYVPLAAPAPPSRRADPGEAIDKAPAGPNSPPSQDDRARYRFERFCQTLDSHLAAHAVELRTSGRIRVAFDIRHLPKELVGTRTYAVCLAHALAHLPEIDLTLLVRDPAQASGLSGRVVTEEHWCDDVAVIHRPAQVFLPRDLRLLFQSSAHLVITYQDLIGYRIPHVYATEEEFDTYRAISSLALPAFQKVLAYSENAASEIGEEFGVPKDEIAIVPLGVEAAEFARREEADDAIRKSLGLGRRYFLTLATDFPHKNLLNLLDAYELVLRRWRDEEPPGLVLAGHATLSGTGLYSRLGCGSIGEAVTFLGPVTHEQLRVLYQDCAWRSCSRRCTRGSASRRSRRWPRARP